MNRVLALAVLVLVILDTGIVQQGPREGRPWILWYDTTTGQQWLEEDPALYHMDAGDTARTWTPTERPIERK